MNGFLMVKLEDIPDIPEGQEALRVEVEWVVPRSEVNVTKMYYLLRESTEDLDDAVISLYESRENGEYHNISRHELSYLVRISPLETIK